MNLLSFCTTKSKGFRYYIRFKVIFVFGFHCGLMGCVLKLFSPQAQGDKLFSFALPIFDNFLLVVFLVLFFFLPKVVFEGRPVRVCSENVVLALDNVVFLTDKCGERPSQCESFKRTKTRHCSQRILRTRFQSLLLCNVTARNSKS